MKHKGKWQNVFRYFAVSIVLNNLEDTFAVLPLAFSMLTSPVYPRNSKFVTAHLTTRFFFYYYFSEFFHLRYFEFMFLKMQIRERPEAKYFLS